MMYALAQLKKKSFNIIVTQIIWYYFMINVKRFDK